jgi:hypothetical protein
MAYKVKIFSKVKKLNKKIKELSPSHQADAVEYLSSLEMQAETFIDNLKAQEKAAQCVLSAN